jgi:hypothetical protein
MFTRTPAAGSETTLVRVRGTRGVVAACAADPVWRRGVVMVTRSMVQFSSDRVDRFCIAAGHREGA